MIDVIIEDVKRGINYYDGRINWVIRHQYVAEKFEFRVEEAKLALEKKLLYEAKDYLTDILKGLEEYTSKVASQKTECKMKIDLGDIAV